MNPNLSNLSNLSTFPTFPKKPVPESIKFYASREKVQSETDSAKIKEIICKTVHLLSGLVRTKNSYSAVAVVGQNGVNTALQTLLKENQRVKKHGFTDSEFERTKASYLNYIETAYNEHDNVKSGELFNSYIKNFLFGVPIPAIQQEYEFSKEILLKITLTEVNALAKIWITDSNRVVSIMAPDKDQAKLPTAEQVKQFVFQYFVGNTAFQVF